MRKFVVFSLIFIMFIGCNLEDHWNYTVKNESSKTVSFRFNNGAVDTLAQSESKNYEIARGEKHTTLSNIEAGSPYGFGFSVKLIHSSTDYTFVDNSPYNLHIANKLPVSVIIKADNYIDYNGSFEIEAAANTEITTAKIYTKKPSFSSITDYPVIIDWEFSNNTVYVIIR